jgi:serine kinase of HPr protein (carbohydrate metabolism regulator)
MSAVAATQTPVSVHATGVLIGESGVIIRGPSGAGKSTLALALLAAAEEGAYFGALVGDDRLLLSADHGRLIARGHPAIRGQIEQRGRGILKIGAEPSAVVRLVVDILLPDQTFRPAETDHPYVKLCGVELPLLALPKAGSAGDLALAVLTWLRQLGAI